MVAAQNRGARESEDRILAPGGHEGVQIVAVHGRERIASRLFRQECTKH
jgi:hypothetical protein